MRGLGHLGKRILSLRRRVWGEGSVHRRLSGLLGGRLSSLALAASGRCLGLRVQAVLLYPPDLLRSRESVEWDIVAFEVHLDRRVEVEIRLHLFGRLLLLSPAAAYVPRYPCPD